MRIRVQKKYDPDTGKYRKQHIYGEGISDKVRSLGTNLFKKQLLKNHLRMRCRLKNLIQTLV